MNLIVKTIISVLAAGLCAFRSPILSYAQEPDINIADAKKAADYLTFNADGSAICDGSR